MDNKEESDQKKSNQKKNGAKDPKKNPKNIPEFFGIKTRAGKKATTDENACSSVPINNDNDSSILVNSDENDVNDSIESSQNLIDNVSDNVFSIPDNSNTPTGNNENVDQEMNLNLLPTRKPSMTTNEAPDKNADKTPAKKKSQVPLTGHSQRTPRKGKESSSKSPCKCSDLIVEKCSLESELDRMKKMEKVARDKAKKIRDEKDKIYTEKKKLQEDLSKAKSSVINLKNQFDHKVNSETKYLQSQLETINEELEDCKKRNEDNELTIAAKDKEIQDLIDENAKKEEHIQQMKFYQNVFLTSENEKNAMSRTVSELEGKNKSLIAENEKLTRQLALASDKLNYQQQLPVKTATFLQQPIQNTMRPIENLTPTLTMQNQISRQSQASTSNHTMIPQQANIQSYSPASSPANQLPQTMGLTSNTTQKLPTTFGTPYKDKPILLLIGSINRQELADEIANLRPNFDLHEAEYDSAEKILNMAINIKPDKIGTYAGFILISGTEDLSSGNDPKKVGENLKDAAEILRVKTLQPIFVIQPPTRVYATAYENNLYKEFRDKMWCEIDTLQKREPGVMTVSFKMVTDKMLEDEIFNRDGTTLSAKASKELAVDLISKVRSIARRKMITLSISKDKVRQIIGKGGDQINTFQNVHSTKVTVNSKVKVGNDAIITITGENTDRCREDILNFAASLSLPTNTTQEPPMKRYKVDL